MFCKYCGKPTETEVCPECAAKAQGQAPAYKPAAPAGSFDLKSYVHFIAVGMAALALIFGLLGMLGLFDINATVTAEAMGQSRSQSTSASVSDTAKALEAMGGGFGMGYVGNIIYGLAFLVVAAIGALYFLKTTQNMPYYDQYIAKYTGKLPGGPLFAMGVIGAAGCVLQFVLYMFCGIDKTQTIMGQTVGTSISVGVSWTTWLMLVLSAGIAALDFFVLNKKK